MSDIQNDSNELNKPAEEQQIEQAVETQATEPQTESKPLTAREAVAAAFEKLAPKEEKTAEPVKVAAEAAATEPTKEIDPISGRDLEPINAPAGMPPGVREGWGKIDRKTQQYVVDREKHMQTKLNETAEERRLASEFREAAAPYEALLRQHNLTAVGYTRDLLKFSHALQTGTPQVRAQMIAGMIQQYQPDAATLQAVLSGQQPVPQQAPVNVQAEVEKALTARQEAEENRTVENAVNAFRADPANEFYADVAPLMAKIVDAGLVEGADYNTLFKNAYDLACQRTPDVKAVLDQRAAATATRQNAPASVQTPKAVPSVKPSLNNGARSAAPAKKLTAREAAEQAYDRLANGH